MPNFRSLFSSFVCGLFAVFSTSCSETPFAEGTETIATLWGAERSSLETLTYKDSLQHEHKVLVLSILEPKKLTKNFSNQAAADFTILFFCSGISSAYDDCDELQITLLQSNREVKKRIAIKEAKYIYDCYVASHTITEQLKQGNTYNFDSYFASAGTSDTTLSRIKNQLENLFTKVNPSGGFTIYTFENNTEGPKLLFHLSTADTTVFCELQYLAKGAHLKNLVLPTGLK